MSADTLPTFETEAWDLLRRASLDRHSPLRNLTLATISEGLPQLRILILRQVGKLVPMVELHTDIRSAKWPQLQSQAGCALLGWHPRHRLQLRLSGQAQLHHQDELASEAWAALPDSTRLSYSAIMRPAQPVATPAEGQKAYTAYEERHSASSADWKAHFGVIRIQISALEVLRLSRAGQLRARFQYAGSLPADTAQWLVP